MQDLPVYLYRNILPIILDLDTTVRGVNRVMYQRNLEIQKGLKNKIRVQFKNSDQKRITISNTQTFIFSMFDAVNQRLLIEKELEVLDTGTYETRGLAELTINESDTIDLDNSSYTYVIKLLDIDGTYLPAYSDTYYGISGTLLLKSDAYPQLQPSQEVTDLQMSYNAETELYEFKSRALRAYPEYNQVNGLHTAAFYLNNFRGTIYIQATLDNNPEYMGYYSTVETIEYNGFTGIDYINFEGVFSYVNFLIVPAKGPTDYDNIDNQNYRGTFDKLLYRS